MGAPSERVQTLAGWGAHADMPSIVLLRMHACTVQAARGPGCCFQKKEKLWCLKSFVENSPSARVLASPHGAVLPGGVSLRIFGGCGESPTRPATGCSAGGCHGLSIKWWWCAAGSSQPLEHGGLALCFRLISLSVLSSNQVLFLTTPPNGWNFSGC